MRPKRVSTILRDIASHKDREEKINQIRLHGNNPGLRAVLTGALDPTVKWLLPKGAPGYSPNRLPDQEGQFYNEIRKLYLFVEGGNPALQQKRREDLFVQLLERIDPLDAEMMIAVKDKKLPVKGITSDIVREALPGLLQDG